MNDGYVKLHRKTLENPIVCKDPDHLAVWIYLLLNATHKSQSAVFCGTRITLQPGQLITGRKSIAARLGINESKVQRVLKLFEIERQIEQRSSTKNRLISVINWSVYQISEHHNDHQVNSDRTATEHKQECKNEKMKRNNTSNLEFDSFWSAYPRQKVKTAALKCWTARIREGYKPDDLITAARSYAAEVSGKEEQYVKLPATFLGVNRPFADYLNLARPEVEPVSPEDIPEEYTKPWACLDDDKEDQ